MSELVSVHVGKPQLQPVADRALSTAIVKQSVLDAVQVNPHGLAGDEPASHQNALYAYNLEHYVHWQQHLQQASPWPAGFFGENLCISGIDENSLRIGDQLAVGTAVLQVSGCRTPCETFLWRVKQPAEFLHTFQTSGRTGTYLEVLQTGVISPGDTIEHRPIGTPSITVADLARFFAASHCTSATIEWLLDLDGLGRQMRDMLVARLNEQIDREQSRAGRWCGWRRFFLHRREREAEGVESFYLKPCDGAPLAGFRGGQFLSVRMPIADGETLTRNWSLSHYQADPTSYRITIKREPHGRGSGYMHDNFQPGDEIELSAPQGQFVLDRAELLTPVVLISAGVGITPMLSMLQAHLARRDQVIPSVHFIHQCRDQSRQLFAKELVELTRGQTPCRVTVLYSQPESGAGERLNLKKLQALLSDISSDFAGKTLQLDATDCRYFVCGPARFQDSVSALLTRLNVPAHAIQTESFGLAATAGLGRQAQVVCRRSGLTLQWHPDENHTLLELAEVTGLTPPFGCRAGQCGLCRVRLHAGKVNGRAMMDDNESVLLCCARPLEDLVIEL